MSLNIKKYSKNIFLLQLKKTYFYSSNSNWIITRIINAFENLH